MLFQMIILIITEVKMGKMKKIILAPVFLACFTVASPAFADWCLQLNGGLSGDLGFFRFKEKLTKKKGKIVSLKGRVAGLSPVFGTATVAKDGSAVEIGVTFFADATQGQFDVWLYAPSFTSGDGYADYGTYDVNQSVTAAVVNCSLEP
jgi:hypothetical protein